MQFKRSIMWGYGALIDFMIGVAIVGIVAAVALNDFTRTIVHVQLIEAALLLPGSRVDLHEHRAMHGEWPGTDEVDAHFNPLPGSSGSHVQNIRVGDSGVLHFGQPTSVNKSLQTLSYRSAVVPENPSSAIVWLCGFAATPPGFIARGTNATDIPALLLPSPCRSIAPADQRD